MKQLQLTTICIVASVLASTVNAHGHLAPNLGRFMQRDPIGYADGTLLYETARGNPIHHLDPSGLCVCAGMRTMPNPLNCNKTFFDTMPMGTTISITDPGTCRYCANDGTACTTTAVWKCGKNIINTPEGPQDVYGWELVRIVSGPTCAIAPVRPPSPRLDTLASAQN